MATDTFKEANGYIFFSNSRKAKDRQAMLDCVKRFVGSTEFIEKAKVVIKQKNVYISYEGMSLYFDSAPIFSMGFNLKNSANLGILSKIIDGALESLRKLPVEILGPASSIIDFVYYFTNENPLTNLVNNEKIKIVFPNILETTRLIVSKVVEKNHREQIAIYYGSDEKGKTLGISKYLIKDVIPTDYLINLKQELETIRHNLEQMG